ncbi:hypothetical protein ACFXDJ_10245 [Streptomyces sp. NPDC059443]
MNHFAPDPVTLQAEGSEIEIDIEDLDGGSATAGAYSVATGLACWSA